MSVMQKMVDVLTPVIITKEGGTVVVMLGTLSLRTEGTVRVSKQQHYIHAFMGGRDFLSFFLVSL